MSNKGEGTLASSARYKGGNSPDGDAHKVLGLYCKGLSNTQTVQSEAKEADLLFLLLAWLCLFCKLNNNEANKDDNCLLLPRANATGLIYQELNTRCDRGGTNRCQFLSGIKERCR